MNSPNAGITEHQLNAWADGRLAGDERTRVDAALAADATLRAHAAHVLAQNQALRDLFDRELGDAMPARLSRAALGAGAGDAGSGVAARIPTDRPAVNQPRFRLAAGLFACAVLGIAIGWLARDQVATQAARVAVAGAPTAVARAPEAPAAVPLTRAAAVAHAAYAPEVRHPVEVGASEQGHLVAWLSKRLGTALRVPDLSRDGFALVGGRLLPDDSGGGVAAQFMFENPGGVRLTLFVRRDPSGGETAFRFAEQGGIGTFYWLDRGFGYALSGELSRDAMLSVATDVYRQLNP